MTPNIQQGVDLDVFYKTADPWGYENHHDDELRRIELLTALPRLDYARCLDIGCGDGFVTFALPGEQITGIDVSGKAIDWARKAASKNPDQQRFRFEQISLFDPEVRALGRFDLIVITGVLYEQYIGKGASVVRCLIDDLLEDGGILASCHIREWRPMRFPYSLLDMVIYPYREYTHQLEVSRK